MTNANTTRYVTELDGMFYAVDYSLDRGNESFGPYATYEEACKANS